jgi:hypothetical protein
VIAAVRNAKHLGAVIVVNVFLGWTFIGWVVALAIAVGSSSRTSRPCIRTRHRPARGPTLHLQHHRRGPGHGPRARRLRSTLQPAEAPRRGVPSG